MDSDIEQRGMAKFQFNMCLVDNLIKFLKHPIIRWI